MTDNISYFQQKVSLPGSSFYYSLLFLDAEKKALLLALCAFWQSIQAILHDCQDPGVARTKLYWWLSDTEKIKSHQSEHPINKAFFNCKDQTPQISENLQDVIKGILYRLDHPHFQTRVELDQFCRQTGGNIMQSRSILLGSDDAQVLAFADKLGIAVQQIAMLRDMRKDLTHDYIFLPLEEMDAHQMTLADLGQTSTSRSLQQLLLYHAQCIHEYYDKALEILPAQQRYGQLSNLIFAKLKMKLVDEISRDGFKVLEKKISLTPLRKLWIAWRMQRKEKSGARM